MIKISKILFVVVALLLNFACNKNKKESAAILYLEAHELLKDKDYQTAAEKFEKIIDDYPFSEWGIEGQVMAVYARYKNDDYIDMVSNIDNFVSLNPNNEYVDYLLYMKGIAYYNQIPNIHRAQNITQESLDVFSNLINRFPVSKYSLDAQEKLPFIIEHIAGSYMEKARFQAQQNNFSGAINNFLTVINDYPNTGQVAEAYYRLAEIYQKLGVKFLADLAILNLKQKHSNSFWFELAQNELAK